MSLCYRHPYAVSSSRDGTIRLWDVRALRQLKVMSHYNDFGIYDSDPLFNVVVHLVGDFQHHLALLVDGKCHVISWTNFLEDVDEVEGAGGGRGGGAGGGGGNAANNGNNINNGNVPNNRNAANQANLPNDAQAPNNNGASQTALRKKKKRKKLEVKRWRLRHTVPAEASLTYFDLAQMVALDHEGSLVIYDFPNGNLRTVCVGIVVCNSCF